MTYLRRSSYFAACAFLAANAFAATPLTSLVNDQTPLLVSIHDTPTLIKNWDQSPWAKTWNDDQVKKFFGPLRTQLKVDEWDEICKRETGYTVRDLLNLAKGDALIALTNLAAVIDKPDSKEPPLLIAVEVGDNVAAIEKLLTQVPADKGAVTEETEDFSGVTIHIRKQSGKNGEIEQSVWALTDGIWVLSPLKDSVIAAIDASKKGGTDNPLSQSEAFLRVKKRVGDAQVTFFANVQVIYPALQKAMITKAGAQPNAPGFDPAAVLPALGVDALRELYVSANIGEESSDLNSGLTFSELRGLLKMISNADGPVSSPAFVPEKWVQVGSFKYSFRAAYAALEEMLETLSPALSGLVQGEIKGYNKKLGIDLKRDLIGSFGETVITAQAFRAGNDPTSHALDQFFAVSLENTDGFTSAIEGLKRQLGPQADKLFVRRDYLGYAIYTFAPEAARNGAVALSYSYAIAKNFFLVSSGSAQPVEAALQGLAGDQPSFWAKAEVKQALADIPSESTAFSFSDLKGQVAGIFDAVAQSVGALNNAAAVPGSDDNKDAADNAGASQKGAKKKPAFVDLSAKPDAETIGKYWSFASGYATRDSNGVYYKSKINHPK